MEVPKLSTQEESQCRREDMLREEEIVLVCSVSTVYMQYKRHMHVFKGSLRFDNFPLRFGFTEFYFLKILEKIF